MCSLEGSLKRSLERISEGISESIRKRTRTASAKHQSREKVNNFSQTFHWYVNDWRRQTQGSTSSCRRLPEGIWKDLRIACGVPGICETRKAFVLRVNKLWLISQFVKFLEFAFPFALPLTAELWMRRACEFGEPGKLAEPGEFSEPVNAANLVNLTNLAN